MVKRFTSQRPEVEGPSQRRIFSLANADRTRALPFEVVGEQVRIRTGQLLGEIVGTVGDVYGVMPLGATSYDDSRAIASLRVVEVRPFTSIAECTQWKNGHTRLPENAVAIPIEVAAPTHPIALIAPDPERTRLADAVTATRTLRIAGPRTPPAPCWR